VQRIVAVVASDVAVEESVASQLDRRSTTIIDEMCTQNKEMSQIYPLKSEAIDQVHDAIRGILPGELF
jgi:hypothetical protein